MSRRIHIAVVRMLWFATLLGLPVVAAEVTNDSGENVAVDAPAAQTDAEQPVKESGGAKGGMAQFQFRHPSTGDTTAPLPPTRLSYQYMIGSESDIVYRRDPDLDRQLRDNSLILVPQVNGHIIYRPTDWLETMLEMIFEKEIAAHEESTVTLPSGEVRPAQKHTYSLAVDQAYLRFKNLGPFELTVGRRNFEDDRHWLYDTSLDVAFAKFKHGHFNAEFSVGRKDMVDLDFAKQIVETRIDNYMFRMDYRGIEDIKLGGYAILRDDRTGKEGKPLFTGVRAYGAPSDKFNFWAELGFLRGKDELKQNFSAYAFDIGGTYRFTNVPMFPSITLGYAFATGDDNPNDNKNRHFRQTGLQSNEMRFGGIPKFKYYGEVLDPELSNVKILTAGIGFRLAPTISVDLVYHRYQLDKLADEIRNWALTAQMSQVDTHLSKDVGRALDVVLGFRNAFGVRRLGLDIRAGLFFPGNAFFRNHGDDEHPDIRRADKGISVFAKIWF